jgi:alkaline phosphatase D
MSPSRREFLRRFASGAGCFVLPVGTFGSLSLLSGCGGDATERMGRRPSPARFPQGVASGDPTPDTVVLWTRVAAEGEDAVGTGPGRDVTLLLEVARDPEFSAVVASRSVEAGPATDGTVRVLVHELEPDTRYWYRFSTDGGEVSRVGRTRTAPAPEADRPVSLAFASCQGYEGGWFGAWRTLVNEDEAMPEGEQLDLVLHLGDFVYEALGYGSARRVSPFPSGGGRLGEEVEWAGSYAVTLDDYRHLWKTYLADPDLQAARARWPFVITWDDHEFSDDAWQGMATFTVPPEPAQARKVAANRAWFEFVPAFLTGNPGTSGIPTAARDFEPVEVTNAPLPASTRDDHGLYREANNMAAIESLTIYRAFRWGRHVELVVTDTRSYRSEHCIPGELNVELSGSARYISPLPLVELLDAGREANDGDPPAEIPVPGGTIPNPRVDAPRGTMLGHAQKEWFLETLERSGATWKLWANSVPAMPLRLDLDRLDPEAGVPTVFTIDTWEGYPSERSELLSFIESRGIRNVLSLAGDNHNNFAGLLAPSLEAGDPSALASRAVAAEFAVCGISSPSVFRGVAGVVAEEDPFRAMVIFDATRFGGSRSDVEALNLTFRHGTLASARLAETGSLEAAMEARNPAQNPHLRYVDTRANGFALLRVNGSEARAELVTVEEPLEDRGTAGAQVLRRARFRVPVDEGAPGTPPRTRLEGPEVEGEPPFPLAGA